MSDSSRDLTREQQTAVSRRGASIVLSSGAGCGKTTVLTERYLDYLRRGEARVGEIAAFTFTDRAAREMRKRIRAAMHVERDRCTDSLNPWDEHLRDLETASIGTIHSFCSNLLRHYALTAGLDPSFEVLDETLSPSLRDAALDETLQSLLTAESPPGDDLRALIELFGWRTTRGGAENLALAADPEEWDEWLRRTPAEIAATWTDFARATVIPASIRHALENTPVIARIVNMLRSTPCKGPKMAANVRAVLDGIDSLPNNPDVSGTIAAIVEAARVKGTEGAKAWDDADTYERVQSGLAQLRLRLPKAIEAPPEELGDLTEAAGVAQRFLRVGLLCRDEYQRRKRSHALLDFDDQIALARDLLRDHPGVRDEVRHRYRYILLDELQDTDPIQMQLVEAICGPGLTVGKLFAVGDSKQSIYRFRGADERLFRRLREQIPDSGRLGLTVNFRSQPAIIEFVNGLFAPHMPDYEPLQPRRPQISAAPNVEFLWTEPEPRDADTGRERHAAAIASRIAGMIHGGERLVVDRDDRARGVQSRDVVLLFRSMTHIAAYEQALQNEDLDYYLVGGRAFFAQQEIYDLLNLLRALENPLDGLSLAGALRSPFGGLSDVALFWLARHSGGLWAGLIDALNRDSIPQPERPHIDRAARFFLRWRSLKDRLPIAQLINEVLADSGYDAALQFERLGGRKLANLWKLIDLARTFDKSGLFGIDDFIRRLDASVVGQAREEQAATLPEEADVIRLMTIHQAKGLEFPVVVLPDLGAKTGGGHFACAEWHESLGCVVRPPADDDPPLFSSFGMDLRLKAERLADWDEDLRTFYVACTRAEDYLMLAGIVDLDKPETNTAMTVLADRIDLRTGQSRDATSGGGQPLAHIHQAPARQSA